MDALVVVAPHLSQIVQVGVDGLARGFIFALLGVGITLVFGLGQVLNLAQGSFATLTVILTVIILGTIDVLLLGIVIAVLAVGVLAIAIDRTLLSFVYREEGEDRILLGIFTTLGAALIIDGVLFSVRPSSVSVPLSLGSMDVLGVSIRVSSLVIIAASAVILGALIVFLRYSFTGKAIRTITQDEFGAVLCGVNPRRFRTLIFLMSALLAASAGIMYGLNTNLDPATAFELTIFALIVSIVGGVRNVTGTVIAGLFLGLVQLYSSFFLGSYVATIILFGIAVIAIVVKGEI